MTDVGPDKDRPTLIFATLNPGKVGEMNDLLLDTQWGVAPMPDDIPEYEETGTTFAENARGKALFTSRRVAVPVLADDSGLEVEALGGEPGVRSARYIDPSISQEARNRKIIDMLEGIGAAQRGARFVCHLGPRLSREARTRDYGNLLRQDHRIAGRRRRLRLRSGVPGAGAGSNLCSAEPRREIDTLASRRCGTRHDSVPARLACRPARTSRVLSNSRYLFNTC